MTVTPADIRANFPEFADATKYPDSQMNFYLGIAAITITSGLYGTLQDYATQLFVAHNIVLDAQSVAVAAVGGFPGVGIRTGMISSESAGGVSVSFATITSYFLENGGDYNLTIYGVRYLRMLRQFGAGPLQL